MDEYLYYEPGAVITSHQRGWLIRYDGANWVYADSGESIEIERPCVKCGLMSTVEGYDACVGYIPGKTSVCCGHGIHEPISM